eukprot:GGOE01004723.1.p3 GENE.GGOE01004723.1~~GGOE01004723.1.p3  ORF type:complete len:101 (+),score=0.32 GGOE01004723.1:336-638(+)
MGPLYLSHRGAPAPPPHLPPVCACDWLFGHPGEAAPAIALAPSPHLPGERNTVPPVPIATTHATPRAALPALPANLSQVVFRPTVFCWTLPTIAVLHLST